MQINNISDEFLIFRFRNGIKLIRPDQKTQQHCSPLFYDTGYTVADVLNLPLNVTFLNHEARTQKINENSAATSGFVSVKSAIGKSIADVTKPHSAAIVMSHNREVIDQAKKGIYEETLDRKSDSIINVFAVKSPWYNADNKVIGLFGCGLSLGILPLAKSLSLIADIGMLHSSNTQGNDQDFFAKSIRENIYFTKREQDVIYFLIRGKSAKNISEILGLSRRTVETHLNHIKEKMGVYTKSDLIEKLISSDWKF